MTATTLSWREHLYMSQPKKKYSLYSWPGSTHNFSNLFATTGCCKLMHVAHTFGGKTGAENNLKFQIVFSGFTFITEWQSCYFTIAVYFTTHQYSWIVCITYCTHGIRYVYSSSLVFFHLLQCPVMVSNKQSNEGIFLEFTSFVPSSGDNLTSSLVHNPLVNNLQCKNTSSCCCPWRVIIDALVLKWSSKKCEWVR